MRAAVGLLDDLRRLHKDIALIQQQINVAVRLIELVTEESKLGRRELPVAIWWSGWDGTDGRIQVRECMGLDTSVPYEATLTMWNK